MHALTFAAMEREDKSFVSVTDLWTQESLKEAKGQKGAKGKRATRAKAREKGQR